MANVLKKDLIIPTQGFNACIENYCMNIFFAADCFSDLKWDIIIHAEYVVKNALEFRKNNGAKGNAKYIGNKETSHLSVLPYPINGGPCI